MFPIFTRKVFLKHRFTVGTVVFLLLSILSFRFLGKSRRPVNPGDEPPNLKGAPLREANPGHPPYGGTLVMGASNQPTIINPLLTYVSVSTRIVGLVFDPLVRKDSQGRIIPGLAESWDISSDGREYTFHLRTGVTFHDGSELNADDVKFTFDAAASLTKLPPSQQILKKFVKEWRILDAHTLRLILTQPCLSILENLVLDIVPKHLLEGQDYGHTDFNYAPVGSGPFRFKSWDRQTNEIELVANPDYFEGRPYLDRIVIKVYPDKARLWAGLMKREVDMMTFMNQADYAAIQEDPAFRTYQLSGKLYLAMAYNTRDPVFWDREVRRAIAYGINIDEILALTHSSGRQSAGPFHPDSAGVNPAVRPIPYDPVMARMLLMHRGWWDKDQDGIAQKGGRDLELRLLVYPGIKFYEQVAMVLRQQLAQIGVKVTFALQQEPTDLTSELMQGLLPQAWLHYFISFTAEAGNEPPDNWFSLGEHRGNPFSYRNEEINQLVAQAMAEPDVNTRVKIYQQVHARIYQEQPVCFLFYPASYHAVSAKFANTDDLFSNYMPVYTIKDWYLSEPADVALINNGS